jgi:hypothetical protein
MFVGLIRDVRPEPWLLAIAGLVDHAVGPLAGYLVVLLAVGVGAWRVERWCARQYWHGLHEHQS